MDKRTAVVLAVASAGLAVLLVSLDLAWNVTARVDDRDNGGWRTITESGGEGFDIYRGPMMDGCIDGEARLVVDNGLPWRRSFDVTIAYWNATGFQTITYLEETWDMPRFSEREHVFTLPPDAFYVPPADGVDRPPGKLRAGDLSVTVGDLFLSACLEGTA